MPRVKPKSGGLGFLPPAEVHTRELRQPAEVASVGLIGGFGLVLGDFEEGGRKQGLVLDGCCQEAGPV